MNTNANAYTVVTFPAPSGPIPGLGWRGGYLSNSTGPDPWGVRYGCTTVWLNPGSDVVVAANKGTNMDTFCLSAGADGNVDTDIESSDLEAQLGRPVRAVAYPVGRRINGAQHIRSALSAAGYQIGMSNCSGVNRWLPPSLRRLSPIDPFDIRRLSTDRQMSDAMFLAQVAVPQLAYTSEYNR